MTEDGQLSGAADRKYDLIISADFLHQLNHVPKLLTQIRKQLHQGGILLFSEVTENSAIQLVTTAYLEEGFGHFTDGRQETGKPLYEEKAWARMLKEAGFVHMEASCFCRKDDADRALGGGTDRPYPRACTELYGAEADDCIAGNTVYGKWEGGPQSTLWLS